MVQMRFLRLHSTTAVQMVTYSCHPGHRLGQVDREVKFLTDTRKQSYLGALKDCVVCTVTLLFLCFGIIKHHDVFYIVHVTDDIMKNKNKCMIGCVG